MTEKQNSAEIESSVNTARLATSMLSGSNEGSTAASNKGESEAFDNSLSVTFAELPHSELGRMSSSRHTGSSVADVVAKLTGRPSARKRRLTVARGGTDQDTEEKFQRQLALDDYFRVVVDGDDGGVSMKQVFERVDRAIQMRLRYKAVNDTTSFAMHRLPKNSKVTQQQGVFHVSDHDVSIIPWREYAEDARQLEYTVEHQLCRKACEHRLGIMQERSRMFFLLNTDIEDFSGGYSKFGGVYSNVTKVDNSIQLDRLMTAEELLEFIVERHTRHPDEIVGKNRHGDNITLTEMLHEHGVSECRALSVEGLGWSSSSRSSLQNLLPNQDPLGKALLRCFMRVGGRLFPMVARRVLGRNENRLKYVHATECRISVFGSSPDELINIAKWLKSHEIGPYRHNMWFLQLRFFDKAEPTELEPHPYANIKTLQDMLDNIFLPLINATLYPEDAANEALVWLFPQIGGIHLESSKKAPSLPYDASTPIPSKISLGQLPVAEESIDGNKLTRIGTGFLHKANTARETETEADGLLVSDVYLGYYVWANLTVLNSIRQRRGMNVLQLRHGCGNGGLQQLLTGFLHADVVTRAACMGKQPVLEYLFAIHRIGVCFAPLAANVDSMQYNSHPMPSFLHHGLCLSLSTEAPHLHHYSSEPLIEEYATCQKMFRLTPLDMTEVARNSVLISSFPTQVKARWLGEGFRRGAEGNTPELSEVSTMRLSFREDVLRGEQEMFRELFRLQMAQQHADATPRGMRPSFAFQAGRSSTNCLSSVRDTEYFAVHDQRIRFPRVVISGPQYRDKSTMDAAPLIAAALHLRHQYMWLTGPKPWEARWEKNIEDAFRTATFNEEDWTYESKDSIFIPFLKKATRSWPRELPTLEDFHRHCNELATITDSVEVKDFAYRRLEILESKFRLHLALNHANEAGTTKEKSSSNRDIYQSIKVDTHIHMAAGMTARMLRDFMLEKLKYNADDIVMEKQGQVMTLGMLMRDCGISKETLTTDQLDVHYDHTLFERFDNFNGKYNPMGNADLRLLLLKTDNYMKGRYFAELINRVFDSYTKDQFTFAENRVSVYGRDYEEWENLSTWFDTHGMASRHNKWMIQVPRLYPLYRRTGKIASYGQFLYNLFDPLWKASLHPSQYPTLHNFLQHVSGFDSVDNESNLDQPFTVVHPAEWSFPENPPYAYYMYHFWANIRTLNEFRHMRGLSTFSFRPHCGESGPFSHLVSCFLVADHINHGINVRLDPSIQYLYYLAQIGFAVAPLSNNALTLHLLRNPFPEMFRRGMNVSLSTDDPLMLHETSEPLIEEYSIAAKVWGLSLNDLCEIARNSVLMSGFERERKRQWLGDRYFMSSSLGNDPNRTHLSDIRVAFRYETYHTEGSYLESVSGHRIPKAMYTAEEEDEFIETHLQRNIEPVLLSTHDQELEIVQREVDSKRELVKIAKARVETLRRQNKALVDAAAEYGSKIRQKLQKQEDESQRRRKQQPMKYESKADVERIYFELKDQLRQQQEIARLFQPYPPMARSVGFRPSPSQPFEILLPRHRWRPLPQVPLEDPPRDGEQRLLPAPPDSPPVERRRTLP